MLFREFLEVAWLVVAAAQEGPVSEFVVFDKTGSQTMRKILADRAKLHGWPRWPHVGKTGLCHYFGIGDCNAVPDGYSVQNAHLSSCDATQRPCKEYTILREPVARVMSSYAYFCQACAESSKYCVRDADELNERALNNSQLKRDRHGLAKTTPSLSCPRMSIADYAVWLGNEYTFRFRARQLRSFDVDKYKLTEEDVTSALEYVRERDTLSFHFTENFTKAVTDIFETVFEEEFANLTIAVTHLGSKHKPVLPGLPRGMCQIGGRNFLTCPELRRLSVALRYDIAFYDGVRVESGFTDVVPPPACCNLGNSDNERWSSFLRKYPKRRRKDGAFTFSNDKHA